MTQSGETVYDPFMGQGTTLIEAALLGRVPWGCDVNPLSIFLCSPRLNPPALEQVAQRLDDIDLRNADEIPADLLVFYHLETLREICALKKYLLARQTTSQLDPIDRWIWMVALNRLTGHSPGFFSVYTLPPNQTVSVRRQREINEKRRQVPQRKYVRAIILKKTQALLSNCDEQTRRILAGIRDRARLLTGNSTATPEIPTASVSLVVTSPPFLEVVDYPRDNWLRCWFSGIKASSVELTHTSRLDDWQRSMMIVLRELHRVLQPGGHIAFEVCKARRGTMKLEEAVLPCGVAAGLWPELVLMNEQEISKTASCWGISNDAEGINGNHIVLFRKDCQQNP
jgi:hypothetical protein